MPSKKKRIYAPEPWETTGKSHHFVSLYDDLLNSPAFLALSSSARSAYIILKEEYKGNTFGSTVICPYSTFRSKGISQNTIPKVIMELEYFGFITTDPGGMEQQPSKYTFSSNWQKLKSDEDIKSTKSKLQDELYTRGLSKQDGDKYSANLKQRQCGYKQSIRLK